MATARKNTGLATVNADGEILDPSGVEGNIPPGIHPEELFEQESTDVSLMSALSELGDEAGETRVLMYRFGGGQRGKRDTWLDTVPADQFNLSVLRDQYGGGEFRVRVIGPDNITKKNTVISVEPKPLKADAPDSAAAVNELGKLMITGFQELGRMIVSAQQATPAAPAQSRTDMLQEMMMMKQVFSDGAPKDNTAAMMEALRMGIELAKGNGGGGETNENDIIMTALDKLGGPLAELFAKGQSNVIPIPTSPAASALPLHTTRTPVESASSRVEHTTNVSTSPSPSPEQSDMNLQLRMAISFLVQQAAANNDPLTYALMAMDTVPRDVLKALVNDPAYFDRLAQFSSRIREENIRAWFDELRTEVQALLQESENPVTLAGNSTGATNDEDGSGGESAPI